MSLYEYLAYMFVIQVADLSNDITYNKVITTDDLTELLTDLNTSKHILQGTGYAVISNTLILNTDSKI